MKRKSPIEHIVEGHTRSGKRIGSYTRGKGQKPQRSSRMVGNKLSVYERRNENHLNTYEKYKNTISAIERDINYPIRYRLEGSLKKYISGENIECSDVDIVTDYQIYPHDYEYFYEMSGKILKPIDFDGSKFTRLLDEENGIIIDLLEDSTEYTSDKFGHKQIFKIQI